MYQRRILDCTLRDGAYLVDKHIPQPIAQAVIRGLMNAGVDVVEVGFLQDEGEGNDSTVFLNAMEARRLIPVEKGKTEFSVLADFSRYTISNLEKYDGCSFDSVRACFFKEEKDCIIPFMRDIVEKGYRLYMQPVNIMSYSEGEILELIEVANSVKAYCFSIVDTHGSMCLRDLYKLYNFVEEYLNSEIHIGFHSHNNMLLSYALSQYMVELAENRRNVTIDTTLAGMGRGAGNTPTELILSYFLQKEGCGEYYLEPILDTIDDYIDPIKRKIFWGYSTKYFLTGITHSHVNNAQYLLKKEGMSSNLMLKILMALTEEERSRYPYKRLDSIYEQHLHGNILNDGHKEKEK